MNYVSKNPALTRSGSAPRTICYTLPTSDKRFSYQTPRSQNVDLKGNLNKKTNPPEAKEDTGFRKVKKSEEPNTNRTLMPEFAPKEKEIKNITRSHSVRSFNMTPGNINSLIYSDREMDLHLKHRKATNPKIYQSFSFTQDDTNSLNTPYKRNLKGVEYKKYDTTTQIVSLPGAVKRSSIDIHDDNKPIHIKTSQSYSTKLVRDYNSNISCLPGSNINNPALERPLFKAQRLSHQSSDIFNINKQNTNSFNISNKKLDRNFGISNDEKKLIPSSRAHRPNQIRNAFESQISII